eukprot:14663286-Alexandrium_andersonii.AAC.1
MRLSRAPARIDPLRRAKSISEGTEGAKCPRQAAAQLEHRPLKPWAGRPTTLSRPPGPPPVEGSLTTHSPSRPANQ